MDAQGRTEVETFIDDLDRNFEANINGLLAVLDRYSKHGPEGMNDTICHLANQREKIWEFIKGRLRLYWFSGGDAVVVCVCGCVKKSQKTDPAMVEKAIQVKREYMRLKDCNETIEIVSERGD
ncbi:MAG: type II toxin-antitoxin system RelE/ParE family toxin [Burkholderiales bacterium]